MKIKDRLLRFTHKRKNKMTMKIKCLKQTKTKVRLQTTKIIIPLTHLQQAVKKDIECTKTFKPKQPHPNAGKSEGEAIKELSKR